jgi:hypothetical protein
MKVPQPAPAATAKDGPLKKISPINGINYFMKLFLIFCFIFPVETAKPVVLARSTIGHTDSSAGTASAADKFRYRKTGVAALSVGAMGGITLGGGQIIDEMKMKLKARSSVVSSAGRDSGSGAESFSSSSSAADGGHSFNAQKNHVTALGLIVSSMCYNYLSWLI